jgi:outer membrane protein
MNEPAVPLSSRLVAALVAFTPAVALAQGADRASAAEADALPTLRVSLAEAVEVALARNYALNRSRIDVLVANQQVREAYSDLYPQVSANASYTRQFDQLNPFAGTSVGGDFLSGDGTGDFLLENEDRVANGQPELSYSEYLQLRSQAAEAAGLTFDSGDNPFFIDNRFRADVSITQLLYDGAAFSGVKGAGRLKKAQRALFEDQARQVVQDISERYYAALLAEVQAEIRRRAEARAREEVAELRQRVERGTRPRFDLLSTEVRLANAEAVRLRAENTAADALDLLKLALGLPQEQPIELSDALEPPSEAFAPPADMNAVLAEAVDNRPDLRAAELDVEIREIEREVAFAGYLPVVEAFFTAAVLGQVPDDRDIVFQPDPLEPQTQTIERGFFDSDFWGPDISGGIRLRWTLFDGLATPARVAQQRLAERRSKYNLQELQVFVRTEVARSVRTLRSTWEQLQSQDRNLENAELNYKHATLRVDEGVAGTVELRDANEQLDNSRLNYFQSVHDYRLAEIQYEVAVGRPPFVRLEELEAEVKDED